MRIAIVVPIHNEAKYLPDFLHSISQQTTLPNYLVLVNDGSTDHSNDIIQSFCALNKYATSISNPKKSKHAPGAKVVNAFYKGFDCIARKDWDVICKFDADVILPKNYLKVLSQTFKDDSVGMAGGQLYLNINGELSRENVADDAHLRGPIKAYSKKCFEQIGGLRRSIGWDTMDVLLARMKGYEVCVLSELKVTHQKATGEQYRDLKAKKMGAAMALLGYDFFLAIIALTKAAWSQSQPQLLLVGMFSYLKKSFSQTSVLRPEERRWIRKYRWNGIKRKLLGAVIE